MSHKASQYVVNSRKVTHGGVFDPVSALPSLAHQKCLLFESADVVTKLGEKSMLFFDIALKFESRNHQVAVTALLDEAQPILKILSEAFQDQIVAHSRDTLTLRIEPLYHQLDLLEKMRIPSALDVMRRTLSSAVLKDGEQQKDFLLAGAFSYDFLDHFEKLPTAKCDRAEVPDYLFYLPLTLIIIDHKQQETSVIAHGLRGDDQDQAGRLAQAFDLVKSATVARFELRSMQEPLAYRVDISDDDFKHLVERCKSHILAGDVYQIVPSRTFSMPIRDPIQCYQALRQLNPSPYMFYMKTDDWTLFGASPETFIKVETKKGGRRVSIRPIAGTRRRGFAEDGSIDDELDSREQASLCLDEKELAEHMMLVDLARNDIASVARPNSRRIKRLLSVDRFSHVMHLVSEVEGTLLKEFDALSAYQASMNMGTLMGAPKVRSAELLRELEASKRGFYGGAVGYLDQLGNMDTSIIIRSALVKGDTAYVRAGCGVVYDSTPQFETQETINKAEAVLRAIAMAGGL
ncbi:MAG TPA: anthranilate synthase component 1 [Myxococcota bacterium]|nr:anthranilate synthase component 1 [Myxococcota bacterium]